MLNQVVIVGRVVKMASVNKPILKLAVTRAYKSPETNAYEVDYPKIHLPERIAANTIGFCREGDIVGVKGEIFTTQRGNLGIKATKITYLSTGDSYA